MAQRRMFSLKIVDTDAFLDMPTSTQALYFHLAMRADDDGFVANPKKIARMLGSSEDDYKVLVAKKFIIPFESGVCVIKHWLIHNLVRGDRYSETQYIREKKLLKIDEKTRKYSLNTDKINVIPNGNQMAPQVRLGKVRLDKVIIGDISETSSQPKKEEPFNFENILSEMETDIKRPLNVIIANYWKYKGNDFIPPKTKEQYRSILLRELSWAKKLEPYNIDDIKKTMYDLNSSGLEWSLKAVLNWIDKDRTKIINFK